MRILHWLELLGSTIGGVEVLMSRLLVAFQRRDEEAVGPALWASRYPTCVNRREAC